MARVVRYGAARGHVNMQDGRADSRGREHEYALPQRRSFVSPPWCCRSSERKRAPWSLLAMHHIGPVREYLPASMQRARCMRAAVQ
jgi:hypothetical protein